MRWYYMIIRCKYQNFRLPYPLSMEHVLLDEFH